MVLDVGKNKIKVPMMNENDGWDGYAEDVDAQVLELPYDKTDLAMVFILPKKTKTLTNLESKLTEEKLSKYLSRMENRAVKVSIPRFKIRQEFALPPRLRNVGVKTLWNPEKADLTGISSQPGLFFANGVHMAEVRVDEEGVVAAAAEVCSAPAAAPMEEQPPPVFAADHPFLYLIRDKATGAVFFMGRVVNPKALPGLF